MASLSQWWNKLCAIHDAVVHIQAELRQLRIELKEFRRMADTNFQNLDAALDQEDQALSQLEQDEQDTVKALAESSQLEQELQQKINSGSSTVDDEAELVRVRAQTQRLTAMHSAIQAQLNPVVIPGTRDPNTGQTNTISSGVDTMTPQPVSASETGPNPTAGETSVSPDEVTGAESVATDSNTDQSGENADQAAQTEQESNLSDSSSNQEQTP